MSKHVLVLALAVAPGIAVADTPPDGNTVTENPRELRRGRHLVMSVGGAYLPLDDGVKAGAVRGGFNWGRRRIEHRLSALAYVATSPNQTTTGGGINYEEFIPIGNTYSFAFGVILGFHNRDGSDGGGTGTAGVTFSPITLRLGAKRNYELGLNGLVLREVNLEQQNYGGFVALSYLAL